MKLFTKGLLILLSTLSLSSLSYSAFAQQGIWIDVRSSAEFNAGHVDGAQNIPHTEIADKIAAVTLDKNAEIHLYCRSGNRSGKALKVLQKMGYTKAVNEGSYSDLIKD
jgi:phage shock protein E